MFHAYDWVKSVEEVEGCRDGGGTHWLTDEASTIRPSHNVVFSCLQCLISSCNVTFCVCVNGCFCFVFMWFCLFLWLFIRMSSVWIYVISHDYPSCWLLCMTKSLTVDVDLRVTRPAKTKTCWVRFFSNFTSDQNELWCGVEAVQVKHSEITLEWFFVVFC